MKISARNILKGTIVEIVKAPRLSAVMSPAPSSRFDHQRGRLPISSSKKASSLCHDQGNRRHGRHRLRVGID
ncbi:hypothetical protein [Mesorhizobium sp. M0254]|uniref:hypothetical protein n=1 Tax=unclassified Mesorhizobium TaxID=325217 RepID=UPI00333931AA